MYKYLSYKIPKLGKFRHSILNEPTSCHSLSSLELLQDSLREREINYILKKYKFKFSEEDLLLDNNFVKLSILRTFFNSRFIKRKEKQNKLYCAYCNKKVRILKEGEKHNKHDVATVDHIETLSEGCDWFDERNINVSCYKCNNERGNMPYDEWLEFIKNKNNGR